METFNRGLMWANCGECGQNRSHRYGCSRFAKWAAKVNLSIAEVVAKSGAPARAVRYVRRQAIQAAFDTVRLRG